MPPVDLRRGGAVLPPPAPVANLRTANNPRGVAIIVPAPAPRPAPAPVPVANLRTSSNPRGVAIIAPPARPAPKPAAPPTFHDAGPTGDYGTKAATAFKKTDAYKQSVIQVFLHQNAHQQQAIVSGALHNTAAPEGQMVLDYLRNVMTPADSVPHGAGTLTMRMPGIPRAAAAYQNPKTPSPSWTHAGPLAMAAIPAVRNLPLSGFEKILSNAAMDAATMPSGTLQGLYSLGKEGVLGAGDLASGNVSGALGHYETAGKQIADPFVQLAEHPVKTFEGHPLNTLLMASGLKSLIGRGIGHVGRVAGADWAATAREPLSLGTISGQPAPLPLAELRSYSKDALNKMFQRAREEAIRARGQNPDIVRPPPSRMPFKHGFNVGQEAKLHRIGDEMSSTHQVLQRAERGRVLHEADQAAPPMKEARDVVTHVLQRVIRTRATAEADVEKEIARLKNARTKSRSQHNTWNKRQVRDLERALHKPGALDQAFASADKIAPTIHRQDAYLEAHRILTPDQITAKYFPYAQAHMDAIYDPVTKQLVEPTGQVGADGAPVYKPLSTDAIRAHMEAHGVPDPAYVGHYPNRAAPWQYYQRYRAVRGTLSRGKRTGEAFRLGGYDHTYEGLRGQLAARAQASVKAGLHDRLIKRGGYFKPREVVTRQVKQEWAKARAQIKKNPDQRAQIEAATRKETASIRTGMYTPAEAEATVEAQPREDNGNLVPGEIEMTPITAASAKTIDWVKDIQDPNEIHGISEIEAKAIQNAINDAKGRTDGVRNVVLVPKALTDRIAEQFGPAGKLERSAGKFAQRFRNAVLPFSTHWMLQIGTEAAVRTALAGLFDPRYALDAKRLMDRLSQTEPGRATAAEMTGATFYGQRQAMNIYHDPGALFALAHRTLPGRAVIKATQGYIHLVGRTMYGIEHNFRLMGLGKLAHDEIREFTGNYQSTIKLEGQMLEQLATRLEADPALVARFGRKIDDLFGQYGKYSPRTRATIQAVMPFLPWYLTAAKYVFWQLPVHHPVASALLASLRQTVNQDIADGKTQPLSAFAVQALGTLSPFGIFLPATGKPGDVASEIASKGASAFLPQLAGAAHALYGQNPFGGQLYGPGGAVKSLSPAAVGQSVNALAEATIPLLTKARQVREGGRPSYGTSSLLFPQPKPDGGPGDLSQILNRTLNPIYGFQRALNAKPRVRTGGGSRRSTGGSYGLGRFGSSGGGGGGGYGLGTFH